MDKTLWIIIIYFVITAVGGLISRQSKKAQQQRRRERSSGPAPSADTGGMPLEDPQVREPEPVRRQTPEEIAAEIRRVMGLEREESNVEVIEEVYEPAVTSPSYTFDPEPSLETEPSHGGRLHERIMARGGGLKERQFESAIATRELGSGRIGGLARRYGEESVVRGERGVRGRRLGSAYVDLSHMAQALVTMEVLGPPKALRDDF